MLISQQNETGFHDAVDALNEDLRRRMLNSSVKLTGQVDEGRADGSGVILYCMDGITTIVTAKHLLFFLKGHEDRPHAWDEELVGLYRDQIRIRYDDAMVFNRDPERSANISAVQPVFQDQTKSWEYDVMILQSEDEALAAFAADHSVYGPNYRAQDKNYLLDEKACLSRRGQTFFQTGYGSVRERVKLQKTWSLPTETAGTNVSRRLQYRTTMPKAAASGTVYNEHRHQDRSVTYDAFVDAIRLDADPNSSTAPNDSGGPLFVSTRRQDEDRLFVIGVTIGADMESSRTPCPPMKGPPRMNNVSASLDYCYRNNLLFC